VNYRPEIDGLRALAVLPVIFFHAGFAWFGGGFVGVDIFFVISGYLITTILISNIEENNFRVLDFYERRARRILPALFFVTLCSIPFAWFWMYPSQLKDFSQSLVGVSLFVSNFLFWIESGYFEAAAEEKPLLHTWSLAVEEQYYLIFPLFLIFAWKQSRHLAVWSIAILAIFSLISSEWGWRNAPNANFYLAHSRAWELFAGSLAAFFIRKHGVLSNNLFAFMGLFAIIISIVAYDESIPFPSLYTLVPVIGVLLLIIYGDINTYVAKLLSANILVSIGLVSYSAYLWHQPLFAFARIKLIEEPSFFLMSCLSIVSIALAFVSWKFVEKPFRDRSEKGISRNKIFLFSIIMIVFLSSIGFLGHLNDGFKDRFSKAFEGDINHLEFHKYIDEKFFDCEPSHIAEKAMKWEGYLRCKQTREGEQDWLLLGDSHVEHLFIGLAEDNPNKNVGFYQLNAKPYIDEPEFKAIFEYLEASEKKKLVILSMFYSSRLVTNNDLYDEFNKTINFLKNAGHDVVLLGDVPGYQIHPEDCVYASSIEHAKDYCSQTLGQFLNNKEVFHDALTALSNRHNIQYIQLNIPLCNQAECSMIFNNKILYRDMNHLNILGSQMVGKYLSNEIKSNSN
jgi:peptidoglycan/LPS O-acetylase OafA/YrhL